MPTDLRCNRCGAEYYTAAHVEAGKEGSCEKCGRNLEIVKGEDDVKDVLSTENS